MTFPPNVLVNSLLMPTLPVPIETLVQWFTLPAKVSLHCVVSGEAVTIKSSLVSRVIPLPMVIFIWVAEKAMSCLSAVILVVILLV